MYQRESRGRDVARIGYDLFAEIRTLLTVGQPAAYASIPTLDLHIALLRDLIVASGAPLVEIPPVPEGYRFIACLTHDVDHPSIRPTQMGPHDVWVFVSCCLRFFGQPLPRTDTRSKSAYELGGGFEVAVCLHGLCERLLARFR